MKINERRPIELSNNSQSDHKESLSFFIEFTQFVILFFDKKRRNTQVRGRNIINKFVIFMFFVYKISVSFQTGFWCCILFLIFI